MVCKIKKSWVDIELEHTKSRKVARKIASDHVKEYGCKYYPALKKMEKKLEEEQEAKEHKGRSVFSLKKYNFKNM